MKKIILFLMFTVPAASLKIPLVDVETVLNVTLDYIEASMTTDNYSHIDLQIASTNFLTSTRLWLYTAEYFGDLVCEADEHKKNGINDGLVDVLRNRLTTVFEAKDAELTKENLQLLGEDFKKDILSPLRELRRALFDVLNGGGEPALTDFVKKCNNRAHLNDNVMNFFEYCNVNPCLMRNVTEPELTRWSSHVFHQLGELHLLTTVCAMCRFEERDYARTVYEDKYNKIAKAVDLMIRGLEDDYDYDTPL